MNDLKEKRNQFAETEKLQVNLHTKYHNQVRQRFDYADTAQWIAQDKNESDLIFISEKLSDWYAKAKDKPDMIKLLNEMIGALFRVQSYVNHLETISKQSVALYVTETKNNAALLSEKKLLEYEILNLTAKHKKELESAKKEIEFLTKNS
jgi:hypothetical protein